MKTWESLPKNQIVESRFTSWLYTIPHNLLVDHDCRRNPAQISPDDVEGLSHHEITSTIGKNQTTSRVMQHRALKALRFQLEHRGSINV